MTIKVNHRKDSNLKKVIQTKVADVRGGVCIVSSELNVDFIVEGTPISAPDSNGKCHVVKFATVQASATDSATKIKILKGHDLKVGDKVFAVTGGKNYAISAIDTSNTGYDEITVGTTLGVALSEGDTIYQGVATTGATAGALLYKPFAIVGTGQPVGNGNVITDAVVIGVTHGNALPSVIASELKGIFNY